MIKHHYPAMTVDVAALNWTGDQLRLLLIHRKNQPYQGQWALPGGFIEPEETLAASALRELQEETGLTGVTLRQCGVFGDPDRDPRGRTISVIFYALLDNHSEPITGADDADSADWFPLDMLPQLAFDHALVIRHVLNELQHHLHCPLTELDGVGAKYREEFKRVVGDWLRRKSIYYEVTQSGFDLRSREDKSSEGL